VVTLVRKVVERRHELIHSSGDVVEPFVDVMLEVGEVLVGGLLMCVYGE
jgi:hypothetical protein